MKAVAIVIGCILAILLLFGGCAAISGVGSYNNMVVQDQQVKKEWGNVQNVYQRRADLIPSLVGTVQGAASFEKSTLQAVIDARASVGRVTVNVNNPEAFVTDANKVKAFMEAQQGLSQSLSRLMVVSEQYPDLKANKNFLELQSQLEGTENRISVERHNYNEAVATYNICIGSFPGSIVNSWFGHFKPATPFEADAGANKAPAVKFDFNSK